MSSTDDPTIKAIHNKTRQKESKSDGTRTTNDWGGFLNAVLKNALYTFLYSLIVINTIFLVRSPDLDIFFPTESHDYYDKSSGMRGGGLRSRLKKTQLKSIRGESSEKSVKKHELLKSLGFGGSVKGWPYSGYSKEGQENGWFTSWLGEIVSKSYIFTRGMWKKIYGWKFLNGLPDGVFFILAPILAIAAMLMPIASVFSMIYGYFTSTNQADIIKYIFFLFPLILLLFIVPRLQELSWASVLLFIPLMISYKDVVTIANCCKDKIGLVFAAFVANSAMNYLEPSYGYSAMFAFIVMLIKAIIF